MQKAMLKKTVIFFLALLPSIAVSAPKELKIGNTAPYSGPLSSLSTMAKTAGAYLKMVSESGIVPYKINFISLDDGWSPPKTVEQTRKLVERDNVDFLFLSLGTPHNLAIRGYVKKKNIPNLFILSGGSKTFDPKNYPQTLPFMQNYFLEAKAYAAHVKRAWPGKKIGVLYQNDDFGKDYIEGFKQGLGEAQKLIVSEQTYQFTDPTVDSQVISLKNSGAEVLMLFTLPKASTQALRKAASLGWRPEKVIATPSNSKQAVLVPAGLEVSKGLITATIGKSPADPSWNNDPGMNEYRAFMRKHLPDMNADDEFAAGGILMGQLLVHVLKLAGNDLSRENIMRKATNLAPVSFPLHFPGISVSTTPTDYNLHKILQMVQFDGEKWVRTGDLIDTTKI